ncbi:MAG: alpha/beta hydrolase [Acidobacteriota bacterium]
MSSSHALLTHRTEGRGDTVLLLNGGFMTYATWEGVAKHLRPDFQLLFCDLRGQPLSPGPSHHDLQDNVADILALLEHLGLFSVHVVATSFGAWVGILLAATEPERVRSLIAVTTTDVATPSVVQGVEDLREAIAEIVAGGDAARFHDLRASDVYSPAYVEAHRDEMEQRRRQLNQFPTSWFEGLSGIRHCTEELDLRARLGEIHCPTLVVHAAEDRLFDAERSRSLAAAIPNAELIEHPSGGHALIAEDPDWLGIRCLEFLKNHVDTRAPGL